MAFEIPESINANLVFPIHEMLRLGDHEDVEIHNIATTSTAYTLMVAKRGASQARYFIKTSRKTPESTLETTLGNHEVGFYQFIESLKLLAYPNIPPCVTCFSSPDDGPYYLVLEDLSQHFVAAHHCDFTDLEHWKAAVSALAHFHAIFWNTLPQSSAYLPVGRREDIDRHHRDLQNAFMQFSAECSERIGRDICAIIEQALPLMQRIDIEQHTRLQYNRNITLVHGDAHYRNFLYPKDRTRMACIIDWQFWHAGPGAYDLRHLLGLGLKEGMQASQKALVEYYYDQLLQHGITGYSWDECWTDYQKGLVDNLFLPVWQYTGFHWPYDRWKDTLDTAIKNYHAFACDTLPL